MNKVIRYFAKRLSYKAGYPLCKPAEVTIVITNKCNFRCVHCDVWKIKFKQVELETNEWKEIILNLRKWLGPHRLIISGGEPLLRKDIFEIFKFCRKLNIYTVVNSNGSLINNKRAVKLAKYVSEIRLSIYGVDRDHNKLRNVEFAYKHAVRAAKWLKKAQHNDRPKITIALMLNAQNLLNLRSHLEWIKRNKFAVLLQILGENTVQVVGDSFARHDPDWYKKSQLWPKNKKEVKKAFGLIALYQRKGLEIINSPGWIKTARDYFIHPERIKKIPCYVTYDALHINAFGNALLCYKPGPLDNLLDKNIAEMWRCNQWNRIRKNLKNCRRMCRVRCSYASTPLDYFGNIIKK